MNSGLNNQNSFLSQLTPAQLEEYQQQLRYEPTFNQLIIFPLIDSNHIFAINYLFQIDLVFEHPIQQQYEKLRLGEPFPIIFGESQQNPIVIGFTKLQSWQDSPLIKFPYIHLIIQFYTDPLLGMNDPGNQMNFAKLLQKSIQMSTNLMNPLLQSQLLFNYNLMPMQQSKSNNCQNPITVEDDEPQMVQKCHNQKCQNKGDRKVKTKKGETLQFCEKCLRLYNRGNFCDFCEQVYSNGSYDQDEQGWIQCDECEKWNHINCEEKFRNQSIREETENKVYYCLNCTKAMKKQNLQPKKQKEDYQPKQQQKMECEDTRGREKNINFVATKDNKIQYTFRLNLYEDEIKQDLDFLRNSGKKAIKKPTLLDSPIIKQVQMPQQDNSESQIGNSRLRTRNNRVKVNYRCLGGD